MDLLAEINKIQTDRQADQRIKDCLRELYELSCKGYYKKFFEDIVANMVFDEDDMLARLTELHEDDEVECCSDECDCDDETEQEISGGDGEDDPEDADNETE